MNVVFFTNPPVVPITGGAERSVVTVADWLETRGHRCFLLSLFPLKKETDDPRCIALPVRGGVRSRRNRAFFEAFLRREKIGAVLWWPGGSRKFPFVEVCNALGVRAISCNRGQPDYYRRAALSKARGFDSLVVRNPLKRAFLSLKLAWKDRKYRRIFAFNTKFSDAYQLLSEHYFPDFRAYFPDGNVPCPLVAVGNMCAFPREEIDIAAKKKELVFVGRLKFADKRPDYLLRIWSRLEKRFPEWTLRLVGSGADEAKLRALAGTPPLNVRVARLQAAFKNLFRKRKNRPLNSQLKNNMKVLIPVFAPSNSYKTTAIRTIYESWNSKLLWAGGPLSNNFCRVISNGDFLASLALPDSPGTSCCRLGFVSNGDYRVFLEKTLKEFSEDDDLYKEISEYIGVKNVDGRGRDIWDSEWGLNNGKSGVPLSDVDILVVAISCCPPKIGITQIGNIKIFPVDLSCINFIAKTNRIERRIRAALSFLYPQVFLK